MTRYVSTGKPRVAIGLPVRNGEAYLEGALESLLAQTYRAFVLVIVDNASTDATEAIGRSAERRDPRVRYVRNRTDVGALANFNRAFELAPTSDYFAWAAYDDLRAPDYLERCVVQLDADPTAVLAYGPCRMIDEAGARLPYDAHQAAYSTEGGPPVHDDRRLEQDLSGPPVARFERVLSSNGINAPVHGLFRREALARTSLHTPHGSDNLLLAEAALLGPFRYDPEAVFFYRIHAASTFYLDRTAWAQRETGQHAARARLPHATLANYLRAVHRAEGLAIDERLRATRAVLAYALRGNALRRLLVPGLDNYFGVTHWPWQSAPTRPT